MSLLASLAEDDIVATYLPPELQANAFRNQLYAEEQLWRPKNLSGKPTVLGGPPDKSELLRADRDLNRIEALLELIDNSVDAWLRRRGKYADTSAPRLKI